MKCRYQHCKLGGEVEKKDAAKDGKMYFHKECYDKHIAKKEIREVLKQKNMSVRDINIMLKKAIDDSEYNIEYVKFIVKEKSNKITDPYKVLYQLKIDTNYQEYKKINELNKQIDINNYIRTQEISDNSVEFDIDLAKNRRLSIY